MLRSWDGSSLENLSNPNTSQTDFDTSECIAQRHQSAAFTDRSGSSSAVHFRMDSACCQQANRAGDLSDH